MTRLGFSANSDLTYWLLERARRASSNLTPGTRAKVELTMWREGLRMELRRTQWSLAELAYLEALWGQSDMDEAMGVVLASLSADADPALAVAHGLDAVTMTSRLTQLGPVQDQALREALTRHRVEQRGADVEGWHQVGVRAVDAGAIA